jgi:hypothetical protein
MQTGEFMRRREATASGRFVSAVLVGMALWITSGCGSIGPSAVNRDRFDYITAISESWKQQTSERQAPVCRHACLSGNRP